MRSADKSGMHPRNRYKDGYDFKSLTRSSRSLGGFVAPNAHGDLSIDYADPGAVKALNQALLKDAYGLGAWDVPPGSLCPPIPGRSDYLHHLADLIRGEKASRVPRGPSVSVLDVGMGASCIYPLIGASEYGWRFVGSDIDAAAVRWARKLLEGEMAGLIDLRLQPSATECFKGVIRPGETFDASMCNPPFHASAAEAAERNRRKRRNLGTTGRGARALNFGGLAHELWCPGGELGFVGRMVAQSVDYHTQCRWFTVLVSRSAHLPPLLQALRKVKASDVRVIGMAQGQKQSRILAWTFMDIPRASAKRARSRD
jgi:23S rRNA (adenine1618-N6)-methyltransferase